MDENSRLSGVLGPCRTVGTTVEWSWALTRERKSMTKHERRWASNLCAWFNYEKVQWTHSFEKTDFKRQLAFEQTSDVPSGVLSLSVSVADLTCCWQRSHTRWFMQENRCLKVSPHERFRVLNLTLKSGYTWKAKDGRQLSQALFATVADPVPMRAWVRG